MQTSQLSWSDREIPGLDYFVPVSRFTNLVSLFLQNKVNYVCFCEKQGELGISREYFRYFHNSSFNDEDLYHMTLISEKYNNENLPFCDVIWHKINVPVLNIGM